MELSAAEKKAMNMEINRQILEADKAYETDVAVLVMYTLHVHLGFGKKRIEDFMRAMRREHDELIRYYQMPDDFDWLARRELEAIGVDVEECMRDFDKEVKYSDD